MVYLTLGGGAGAAELPARAAAPAADLAHGEELYRLYCVRCHRAHGAGSGERQFPQLAGQREDYLLEQLTRIVTLGRDAPEMHEVLDSHGLSSSESLHDLAAYLATQPRNTHGEHGDGHFLGRGRQVYLDRCESCHGLKGEGQQAGLVPALSGQNYTYLLAQLHGFAAGHRSKADPTVIEAVRQLSSQDMQAVADFLSRLPESADLNFGVAPH